MMWKVLTSISLINLFLPLVVSQIQSPSHLGKYEPAAPTATSAKTALRIVGGKAATLSKFPFMVSFKIPTPGGMYENTCGGSLIKPNRVLSAAQCFKFNRIMLPLDKFYAVMGSLKNKGPEGKDGQWKKLSRVNIHKAHMGIYSNIAVALTKGPFKLSKHVKTVQIAMRYTNYGSISCNVAGFGQTDVNSQAPSDVLMYASIKLISAANCSRLHNQNMRNFICASKTSNSYVLPGDMGGPLTCSNFLVGIVCGMLNESTIFTRVSSYTRFIVKGQSCRGQYSVMHIVWLSFIVSYITCYASKNTLNTYISF